MLRWRKLGLVFSPQALPERPPWLAEFAQAPATLLFEEGCNGIRVLSQTIAAGVRHGLEAAPDRVGGAARPRRLGRRDAGNLTALAVAC